MKKIIIIIAVLIFSVSIASCKNKKEYTYTFKDFEGIIKEETAKKGSDIIYPDMPEEKEDAGHIYTFKGWDNNATTLNKDEVFTAIYERTTKKFRCVFLDSEDNIIKEEILEYDSTIIYPENPTKESTVQYTYTFKGWDNNATIIKEDITFKPIFDATLNKYTYTFVDWDDSVLKEVTDNYGAKITAPTNPSRPATAQYTYTFKGWDKTFDTLEGDITMKALYNSSINKYTYTFVDWDDTVLKQSTINYGTKITAPTDPSRSGYRFVGWDKEFSTIKENITIKAVYEELPDQVKVSFYNPDNTLYTSVDVDLGGTISSMPDNLSGYEDTKYKYTFSKWVDSDGNVFDEDYVVNEDISIYPLFSKKFVTLEGLTLSILGDSISTFYAAGSEMNSYYTGDNEFYYPRYSATVKTVDKTWWYQLIKENKMQLGINNSLSGSSAWGAGSTAGMSTDRLSTLDDNGTPDIVIVYLGTNDNVNNHSNDNFKKAITTIVEYIQKMSSDTQIYIANLGYTAYTGYYYTENDRISYNNIIKDIVNAYGLGLIDLAEAITTKNYSKYLGDNLHYNAEGAARLAIASSMAIHSFNNLEYDKDLTEPGSSDIPGVICTISPTNYGGNFWTYYANNIIIYDNLNDGSDYKNPQYSLRIFMKDTGNNTYEVVGIYTSGQIGAKAGDYAIIISELYPSYFQYATYAASIKVGTKVTSTSAYNAIPNTFSFLE